MGQSPIPTACLILEPRRHTTPNAIQMQLAIFPQLTHWTNRQADRATDGRAGKPVRIPTYAVLY